jgi:multiple sugar transport system substrate-binding protein
MNSARGTPGRTRILVGLGVVFALLLPGSTVSADPIVFLSTQLIPLPEATMIRQVILKDFPHAVDFEPYDDRTVYNSRVLEHESSPADVVVLGGLQEDFLNLYRAGLLTSVDSMWPKLHDRAFLPRFSGRGVFGTDGTYFVPWMQATYLMAANTRALKYLPKGADLKRLSYDDLKRWADNMFRATGKGKLGFPVGPKGLMHRFLQGYLYPSFTGSIGDGFSSQAALAMWKYLRDLWESVAPSSLILNRMDDALLSGEVWVAWDHSARLLKAFQEQPGQFVAFPVPVGPRGRGFITVVSGLGLPRGSSSSAAESLIEYLTRPSVQVQTMESVGFLPVVAINSTGLSPGLSALLQAAADQSYSPDSILSSVPLLGADDGRRFNLVYMVAFSQVVLRGRETEPVLVEQEKKLKEIRGEDRPSISENRGH